jgi:uncharacterized protein (DUF885 family)
MLLLREIQDTMISFPSILIKISSQEKLLLQFCTETAGNVDYKTLSDEDKVVYDVLDYTLKDKIEAYAYHPEYIPFTQFGGLPLISFVWKRTGKPAFQNRKRLQRLVKRMEKFPNGWMLRQIISVKGSIIKWFFLKTDYQNDSSDESRRNHNSDMDKNIFYGPVKNFPKTSLRLRKINFQRFIRKPLQKNHSCLYQNGNIFEKEYLPKGRDTDGYNSLPNGNEIYSYYVKSWTTTKKSPEEINKIGLQQVAMLRAEMEKVKQQVGFSGTLEEFITFVKTDPKAMPYKTSKDVLNGFNSILAKITPKLKTMFNVTPKTKFEIRQTEKFREASASAEYIPGTPDGKRPGIFYVPLPDPTKFNVTSGMESLFLHEAIPGHHYQVSLQQENTKLPKFMRFGWFGAYGEGWAHYCETLGPEFGLYTDPYQKMGYLSDQMLRAVRLVVDTGLHTGKMSREKLSNIS